MPAHPIDFQIQADTYSTPELAAIFDEQARFGRWLAFEAALALVQGELGIIPMAAAEEISDKATIGQLDLDYLAAEYKKSRNSLVPLLKGLRRACGNGWGEFVHYGVTTQDVLDTAQIIEIRETLQIFYRDLRQLEEFIVDLALRHKDTGMAGRTHGQQALPITFGLKAAVWAAEIRRHLDRLQSLFPRIMTGQLSGAVGTMAALGPRAREVSDLTLQRLGLKGSTLSWHTARDRIAETAAFFAMATATFEKIANEIYQLGKTEIGELGEPAAGGGASSTMPHKRNPVACQRVAVLARHVRALANIVTEGMVHEHERDARCLWSEWLAMPQICIYSGTAINYLVRVMKGLEVNTGRMQENLGRQQDMLASEWLLFRLGSELGRMRAQERLHELAQTAAAQGSSLLETLTLDAEIGRIFTAEDLAFLKQPGQYIGQAARLIEEAVTAILASRGNDPEVLRL